MFSEKKLDEITEQKRLQKKVVKAFRVSENLI